MDFLRAYGVAMMVVGAGFLLGVFPKPPWSYRDSEGHETAVRKPGQGLLLLAIGLVLAFLGFSGRKPQDQAAPAGPTVKEAKYKAGVEVAGLTWTADLGVALRQAAEEERLVLLEMTARGHIDCAITHKKVFPRPAVREALTPYTRVMLHVGGVPEEFYAVPPGYEARKKDGDANYEWEEKVFETAEIPLYAVLRPRGGGKFETMGVFRNRPNKEEKLFLDFLRDPAKYDRWGTSR